MGTEGFDPDQVDVRGCKRSGIGKDLGRQPYEANLHFKSVQAAFAA